MLHARLRPVAAASAAAFVFLFAAESGQAESVSRLAADVSRTGNVDLIYVGFLGSKVYFDERVGNSVKRIGSLPIGSATIGTVGYTTLREATVWRCDRLVRYFEATAVLADGTREHGSFDVRTDSCARRFKLQAPARARLGSLTQVRVLDRWHIGGIRTRLCITPPRGRAACRSLGFLRAVDVASQRFHATKKGLWKIELRVRGFRVRTAVNVGSGGVPPKRAPTVLATGDSTMQGIDSFLADRLAETAQVRSDVHIGTGISKGTGWIGRAAQQALRVKPKTTVISIGGGEGYGMQTPGGMTAACCGDPWLLEYARRVRLMMNSYRQRGAGKLLWLAQPAQRSAGQSMNIAQVNKVVLSVAAGMPGVKVLRLDALFSPRGYREVMRYRGQDVRVGAADGIHLTTAGTAIAAEAIEDAIRKDW